MEFNHQDPIFFWISIALAILAFIGVIVNAVKEERRIREEYKDEDEYKIEKQDHNVNIVLQAIVIPSVAYAIGIYLVMTVLILGVCGGFMYLLVKGLKKLVGNIINKK